jgi:hypothetical protein
MANISPGYNFTVTEEVTAAKLKTFVEQATINDINWSEVDDTIPRFAVTASTSFSIGPEGSIWWDDVARALVVQSKWGPVALWGSNSMETRRLEANPEGFGPLPPWRLMRIDSSGGYAGETNPAFEMASGVNNLNLAEKIVGVLQNDTAVTGEHSRLVMHGVTKVQFSDWQQADDAGEYGGSGTADGHFLEEGTEAVDKVCGVILGSGADEAAGASTTGFIFLFPNIWRA